MRFDQFLARVGQNVRKARYLAGLTQEEVAAKGEISFRYYAEIERGARNPSLEMLFTIAGTLGVSVEQLVDVEPERARQRLANVKAEQPRRGRRPRRR